MRPGVSEYKIHKAANELLAKGIEPSARKVRKALGGGSLTTINNALQSWRERHPKSSESADPIEMAVSAVYDSIAKEVEQLISTATEEQNAFLIEAEAHLVKAESSISDLSEILAEKNEDYTKIGAELNDVQDRLLTEQQYSAQLKGKVNALVDELEAKQKAYNALAYNAATEAKAMTSDIGRLNNQLEASEKRNADLSTHIEKEINLHRDCEVKMEAVAQSNQVLEQSLARREAELSANQRLISELKDSAVKSENRNNKAIDQLNERCLEKDRVIERLQSQVESLSQIELPETPPEMALILERLASLTAIVNDQGKQRAKINQPKDIKGA